MAATAPGDVEAANGAVGEETEDERRGNIACDEVRNLVEIGKDPFYKAAANEWYRKESYFGNRVDRREKSSADLVNQIFNIVGFFSVFQGVVLTAVTQLTSDTFDTCGLILYPVLLSIVAGVVTLVGVTLKVKNLQVLEKAIYSEKFFQKEAVKRSDNLQQHGRKFRFSESAANCPNQAEKLKSFHLTWICVCLSLVAFTVLFVLSYFAILCDTLLVRAWKGGLPWLSKAPRCSTQPLPPSN